MSRKLVAAVLDALTPLVCILVFLSAGRIMAADRHASSHRCYLGRLGYGDPDIPDTERNLDFPMAMANGGTLFILANGGRELLRVNPSTCGVERVQHLKTTTRQVAITFVDNVLFGINSDGQVTNLGEVDSADALHTPRPSMPGESRDSHRAERSLRATRALNYEFPVLFDRAGIYPNKAQEPPARPGELGKAVSANRAMISAALPEVQKRDGTVIAYKSELKSKSSADITLFAASERTHPLARAEVAVPKYLGEIQVIAVLPDGGFVVSAESFGLSPQSQIAVDRYLYRFDAEGRLKSSHMIQTRGSSTRDSEGVTQNVFWDPGGDKAITVPVSTPRGLALDWLTLSEKRRTLSESVVVRAAVVNDNNNWSSWDDQSLSAGRLSALARARDFVSLSWTAKAENLNIGHTQECAPPRSQWALPIYLSHANVGDAVYGVPYRWGGKEESSIIGQRLAAGAIAGNVCCKLFRDSRGRLVPTVEERATGIDCSGLVARAWDLKNRDGSSRSVGTGDLVGIGAQIKALEDLEPADALDKPSHHVRLFVGWIATPKGLFARAYESTPDQQCSGVCLRDLPLRRYAGYRPIAMPH